MRRLYFLIPDAEITGRIVNDLLLARIPERQVHIVAKDHELLQDAQLPEAGLLQEPEVVPAIEKGLAAGGAAGLLAGLVAVTFPPAGLALGGGALLGTTLGGAAFGALVGPMIGIRVPNSRLTQLEEAVETGQFLVIVELPKKQLESISELVKTHYPEVTIEGAEPEPPPLR
jgi:hypothetical protein